MLRGRLHIMLLLCAAYYICIVTGCNVEAARSDMYRDMLHTGRFCLIYSNQIEAEGNNKELRIFQKERYSDYLEKKNLEKLVKGKPGKQVIASDGENFYRESNYGHVSECQLEKQGLRYVFSILTKPDQEKEFYGQVSDGKGGYILQKNKITEQPLMNNTAYKRYFLDNIMDCLLSPILPENKKRKDLPGFQLVGEGLVEGDLYYEDYICHAQNHWDIMRYYFRQNDFVQIAEVKYDFMPDGSIKNYKKTIVNIDKFTGAPAEADFAVPAALVHKQNQ